MKKTVEVEIDLSADELIEILAGHKAGPLDILFVLKWYTENLSIESLTRLQQFAGDSVFQDFANSLDNFTRRVLRIAKKKHENGVGPEECPECLEGKQKR